MSERTEGAPYFRLFAGFAKAGGSPLYERLALAAAEDPQMLAVAAQARKGQPQANILLGAVHALLLGGADDPLKDYYPSCGGARPADDGDVYGVFKSFVERNREALAPIIASRVTNTNEVGRSALVYPALDVVACETGEPLKIVEIGPSAGLNLNWHRYGYRYRNVAGETLLARQTNASLVLESELRGARAPDLSHGTPAVESSLGIERNPVDLADPDARLWLRALIWPERTDRLARLDAALSVATAHPPRIEHADATRDLARHIRSLGSGPVCIFHTLVTYQMSESEQAAFDSMLDAAASERALYVISVEWEKDHYALQLSRREGARISRRELAACDPHGGWLEWMEN